MFPLTCTHTSDCVRLLSHGCFTGCGSLTSSSVSSFRILAFNFLLSRHVVVWIPERVIIGTLSWEKKETRKRKPLMREGRWRIPSKERISPARRRLPESCEWEKKSESRRTLKELGRADRPARKEEQQDILSPLHSSRTISGTGHVINVTMRFQRWQNVRKTTATRTTTRRRPCDFIIKCERFISEMHRMHFSTSSGRMPSQICKIQEVEALHY